jgi:hypothetical protein
MMAVSTSTSTTSTITTIPKFQCNFEPCQQNPCFWVLAQSSQNRNNQWHCIPSLDNLQNANINITNNNYFDTLHTLPHHVCVLSYGRALIYNSTTDRIQLMYNNEVEFYMDCNSISKNVHLYYIPFYEPNDRFPGQIVICYDTKLFIYDYTHSGSTDIALIQYNQLQPIQLAGDIETIYTPCNWWKNKENGKDKRKDRILLILPQHGSNYILNVDANIRNNIIHTPNNNDMYHWYHIVPHDDQTLKRHPFPFIDTLNASPSYLIYAMEFQHNTYTYTIYQVDTYGNVHVTRRINYILHSRRGVLIQQSDIYLGDYYDDAVITYRNKYGHMILITEKEENTVTIIDICSLNTICFDKKIMGYSRYVGNTNSTTFIFQSPFILFAINLEHLTDKTITSNMGAFTNLYVETILQMTHKPSTIYKMALFLQNSLISFPHVLLELITMYAQQY